MRRHKISDWNIWYGAFGKTDYARQMGNFVAFKGIIGLVFIVPFYMFLTAVHLGIFLVSVLIEFVKAIVEGARSDEPKRTEEYKPL